MTFKEKPKLEQLQKKENLQPTPLELQSVKDIRAIILSNLSADKQILALKNIKLDLKKNLSSITKEYPDDLNLIKKYEKKISRIDFFINSLEKSKKIKSIVGTAIGVGLALFMFHQRCENMKDSSDYIKDRFEDIQKDIEMHPVERKFREVKREVDKMVQEYNEDNNEITNYVFIGSNELYDDERTFVVISKGHQAEYHRKKLLKVITSKLEDSGFIVEGEKIFAIEKKTRSKLPIQNFFKAKQLK